jgi:hypothetical protein
MAMAAPAAQSTAASKGVLMIAGLNSSHEAQPTAASAP